MADSSRRRRRRSKQVKDQSVLISKFGLCVIALADNAGHKPASWLKERTRVSNRHANRLIRGSQKVSARALAALIREIVL